jgi:hypothetical protein
MGQYDIAIAGGVEHMGNHPMGEGIDPNPRYLAEKLVDTDALQMGMTAERLHDKFPHLTKARADAYAVESKGDMFLINSSISEYKGANQFNHEVMRRRKLLLHKKEMQKILGKIQAGISKSMACKVSMPLLVSFKDSQIGQTDA